MSEFAVKVSKYIDDNAQKNVSIKFLYGIAFAITALLISESSIAIHYANADGKDKTSFDYVWSALLLAISVLFMVVLIALPILNAIGKAKAT